MKRMSVVILIALSTILVGCIKGQKVESNNKNIENSNEVYFTTTGYAPELSENYMVVLEEGLKIIDLNSKEVIKEIELPNDFIRGYDIFGTKVVWSAYSSVEEIGKDTYSDEAANTDIFLYDIADDSTTQITSNRAGQSSPDIWGDYIVWEDNRNDTVEDENPEWDIYLYNLATKEEKLLTTASGIHTNPCINDFKVVWEDGRNFEGEKVLRWGGNVPENNTDIYMYDIRTGEEVAITKEPLQECNPCIYGNYIVWEDRNEKGYEAEIYLFDIDKKEKTQITDDMFDQTNPKLFDKYIVWLDERNGIATNDLIVNGKAPNSDIFLYDIESKKEYLMSGEEPQIMPVISENYIAYLTSRKMDSEIQVVKYK